MQGKKTKQNIVKNIKSVERETKWNTDDLQRSGMFH